mmetsp:Transcript_108685/g.188021  ORF Transcript_108685/g.188021 Transcript_108685/m.188021 type:complete len:469 (-) Transcript_108685:323-1729(-)
MKLIDVALAIAALTMTLMWVGIREEDEQDVAVLAREMDNHASKLWQKVHDRQFNILAMAANKTNSTYISATYNTIGTIVIAPVPIATVQINSSQTWVDPVFTVAGTKTVIAGVTLQLLWTSPATLNVSQTFAGAGGIQLGSSTGAATELSLENNATLEFASTSAITVVNAKITVAAGSNVIFQSTTAATTITSATFTLANTSTLTMNAVASATALIVVGGTTKCSQGGASITAVAASGSTTAGNKWSSNVQLITGATRRRLATSFATSSKQTWCGDDNSLGSTTVADTNGLIIDTSCAAAKAGTLSIAAGGYLVFKSVSQSSTMATAKAFTMTDTSTVEVLTSSAADYMVKLLEYPMSGTSCFAISKPMIDACATGYTCSIYDHTAGSTCHIVFKSVKDVVPTGSNTGLYGLLALLVIPFIAILLFVLYKMHAKPVVYQEAIPDPMYAYVDPAMYEDTAYPPMNTPVY